MKDIMIEVPNADQASEATVKGIAKRFGVAAAGFDETYPPVPLYRTAVSEGRAPRPGEKPDTFLVLGDQETADALQKKDPGVHVWANPRMAPFGS